MAKILIVDDESGMGNTLRQFLEKEKHTVSTACDAQEAVQILNEDKFDLVVSDYYHAESFRR